MFQFLTDGWEWNLHVWGRTNDSWDIEVTATRQCQSSIIPPAVEKSWEWRLRATLPANPFALTTNNRVS